MKKQSQLGMNPGTASHRLIKDLLFKFAISSGCTCYRCGGELTRDSFSIEHKKPWLDSDDPVKLFFDLDNIAFSHLKCNIGAARKVSKYKSRSDWIEKERVRKREYMRANYSIEARREKFKATGY